MSAPKPGPLVALLGDIDLARQRWPDATEFAVLYEIAAHPGPNPGDAQKAIPDPGRRLHLYLLCVEVALLDHALTDSEVRAFGYLRTVLGIGEEELYESRPHDVQQIVLGVMYWVLTDGRVDPEEARLKVAIQEVMNLSYDQFVAVAKPALADAHERAVMELGRDNPELERRLIRLGLFMEGR